ncbi:hypothetical protein [Streptomyces lydicus]|uniref:hypothetical protein n=1 Tax=Streptomyces lydicus TaxID=47763 RepID=UPI0010117C4B|nr:hypothetical protein [Streptomyces lydicus]
MFSLGPDGMRDLQERAEGLSADLACGQWKPNRFDKRALRKLAGTDRDAITSMFIELGPRQGNKMTSRLVTLLANSAAAQDMPSIAELPEAQEALSAVSSVIRSAA